MKLYGGIDLHSNINVAALVDDEGQKMCGRHLPHRAATVLEALAPYSKAIKPAGGTR
jgi:transposase